MLYFVKVVLVGHNWGWMVGAEMARRRPTLFSKLVILNTNNLPDGEALLERYFHDVRQPALIVLVKVFLHILLVAVPSHKFLVPCISSSYGPPPTKFPSQSPTLLLEQRLL